MAKGDPQPDIECPRCGEDWDSLMQRPAVFKVGKNFQDDELYDCWACESRFVGKELETGKTLQELIEGGYGDVEE